MADANFIKQCIKCGKKKLVSRTMQYHMRRGIGLQCLSCSLKGNKHNLLKHSIKTRKKMSKSALGKPKSLQHRLNMSKARRGIKRLDQRGENHYNWKGGKYTDDYRERRRFRDSMQKQIFERDNYTCQMCGARGELQVDHIQSWSDYVELRFSIDNCRTLCAKCHYKITFGREMPEDIKGWGHNFLRRVNP
jgi:nitrate/TMAO reductase-like tetraheme cytochrome c subunit